ncbi:hypothetical protein OPIT5_29450 [Opitutaceae bacterium TAV5]|nr:hypothetical protein OPIT5_29450 [Opitutaceae bacterium TAV5]
MFARELFAGDAKTMTAKEAKQIMKRRGWSYRTAAPRLGVCYQHLSDVLNRRRASRSLVERVAELPERTKEAA